MRRRVGLSILLMLSLAGAAHATIASASFGPIEIQSVNSLEQAERASEPAISADGRYLAFRGTIEGREGVFRKDLESGALELVAGGSIYEPESEASDASAPSISADGRYVSFSSHTFLMPRARANGNVYVRDMDVPLPAGRGAACSREEEERIAGKACAYELASALNETTEGIDVSGELGAVASGRVALSGNGREVAFVLDGASDLVSRSPGELTTESGQVVVRNLETRETILVSTERERDGQMTEDPIKEGAVTAQRPLGGAGKPLPGAAISADGTAVAWLGAHIPAQVPTLIGEREQIEHDDGNAGNGEAYDEPLWRRIDQRPLPPTRRILGGGDPLAPGCPPNGTLAMPACQGPFPQLLGDIRGGNGSHMGWLSYEGYDGVPQLSADGWTVALIGDPRPANASPGDEGGTSNVFVVNMHEGLDRVQALRQLTREVPVLDKVNPGTSPEFTPSAGDIYDVGISPDGERIAFATQRQLFPLAPPNFDETPLAQLGVSELYQIDLSAESLQRVTHGPNDGPSLESAHPGTVTSQGASSPSYTADDDTVAFADTASNLVAGDANEASDVFTVTSVAPPGGDSTGSVEIGPGQPSREPARPQWRLSVVPVTHADGSVTLDVAVPGAGHLAASATAAVPVAGATKRARRGAKASPAASHASKKRVTALRNRTVASTGMTTALAGLLELPMRVAPPYRELLSTAAGIYAKVRVAFSGPGGPALSQTVVLTLRKIPSRKVVKRAKAKLGHPSRSVPR